MKKVFLAFAIAGCSALWGAALGQTPAAPNQPGAPSAAAPSPAAPAAVPITDADLKSLSATAAEDKAKGDPSGAITGTVGDIPLGDAKKGLAVSDVVNL